MITKTDIDGGTAFDWGKTSPDYAVYRPGYPASFYTILQAVGIGRPGQHILDLGTGTGVLARAFAQQGAHVIGVDIADTQIVAAQQLAAQEHLDVRFMICAAEEGEFPPQSFDIISCGQSWLYFDTQRMIPLVKTWLKPGGKLVLMHLSWLPRKDRIAQASEQLILRYNPQWSDADFPGSRTIQHAWSQQDFRLVTYHAYEEGIPFTRESWRGRIRACRGIGATLQVDEVARFDQEHDGLLRQIAAEEFTILHQVWLHAYTPIGDADTVRISLSENEHA
jgi:cyclopropane fatty-acyl-phospholipid synthase-like methyltransferase